MQPEERQWFREAITDEMARALCVLGERSLLDRFYLAGGTALALYFGHRRSVDLDFFSDELFDQEALLQKIQTLEGVGLLSKAPHTLHLTIRQVQASFLGYAYPLLFPLETFQGVQVADPRDIASMKMSAIAARGTRRDFIDLHVAAEHYGLPALFGLFQKKYARVNYSMAHIRKSLTYFEDAEREPMPDMLAPLSWEDVKRRFQSEVPRLERS